MGGTISDMGNLENYLPMIKYHSNLNENQQTSLFKSSLYTTSDQGPIVCKLINHLKEEELRDFEANMRKIISEFTQQKHPNNVVYRNLFSMEKNTVLVYREYLCYNLNERIQWVPYVLTTIEKKWLIFQLLCAVRQIHWEGCVHGDIKPENIKLTSYNWLFLTDMITCKPASLIEDDIKRYNEHFGELDNNVRCYLAPERFKTKSDDLIRETKPEMDIFSAGCVIAEILMDGVPLFDLPRLQNYRKGLFDPSIELDKKVKDKEMVKLVLEMIKRLPEERPKIGQCLNDWQQIMPRSFYNGFFQLGAAFLRKPFTYSDSKLSLLRRHFDQLWHLCYFDKEKGPQSGKVSHEMKEPIEPVIFDQLQQTDKIDEYETQIIATNAHFQFLTRNKVEEDEFQVSATAEEKESIVTIVHWIGMLMPTCFYPQSKMVGLEMLLKIAQNQPFEVRIKDVLPYVIKVIESKNQAKVYNKAIEVVVQMFEYILNTDRQIVLQAMDYRTFSSYIMQALINLQNEAKHDISVQRTLALNLAKLAQIGYAFLEISVSSRIHKKKEFHKAHQGTQSIASALLQNIDQLAEEASSHEQSEEETQENNQDSQTKETQESTEASKKDVNIEVDMIEEMDQASKKEDSKNDGAKDFFLGNSRAAPGMRRGTLMASVRITDQQNQLKEHNEVFVNFDDELNTLRSTFQSIINDIVSNQDSILQITFLRNLGPLSNFFGTQKTIDFLVPQCQSCFNNSDFRVRIEFLRNIANLGLKVGKETFSQFLLVFIQFSLNYAEDMVVLETLKTFTKLLALQLLTKKDALETCEKVLPFLVHPNKSFRQATIDYLTTLADSSHPPKSLSKDMHVHLSEKPLLQKADFFCLVRPNLRHFLKDGCDIIDMATDTHIHEKLRKPMSYKLFQRAVNNQGHFSDEYLNSLDLNDKFAIIVLKDYFAEMKRGTQSKAAIQSQEIRQKQSKDLQKVQNTAKTYRVLLASQASSLAELYGDNAGYQLVRRQNDNMPRIEQKANYIAKYQDRKFCDVAKIPKDQVQSSNFGLNTHEDADLGKNYGIDYETDKVLRAINLVPECPETESFAYQNRNILRSQSVQNIKVDSLIHVENLQAQPSSIPQYQHPTTHHHHQVTENKSKNAQVGSSEESFIRITENSAQPPQIGKDRSAMFRPRGRLVTTLHEHQQPVNTITVLDDQKFFLTGSKKEQKINMWQTARIDQDQTSHAFYSIDTQREINQICTLQNSQYLSVAGSNSGLDIIDLARIEQGNSMNRQYTVRQQNSNTPKGILSQNASGLLRTIQVPLVEGEIQTCSNMKVHQDNLLAFATQKGSFYMQDLRDQRNMVVDTDLFGSRHGTVTSMAHGQNPYQMVMGTLGGYILVYDIRYNIVMSQFKHHMRYPINAVSTVCSPNLMKLSLRRSDPLALVSAGGPNYELSLLNLQTGHVEILFTVNDQSSNNQGNIMANGQAVVIPEYFKESQTSDGWFATRKVESNNTLLRRYLQSSSTQSQMAQLNRLYQQKILKNSDQDLLTDSKNRCILIKQANESASTCRSILVPRDQSSLFFNGETAGYAITGGNDHKLRYWNLQQPSLSYYINTPDDAECKIQTEEYHNTLVVQEHINKKKEFPTINSHKVQKQPMTNFIMNSNLKFPHDSPYYNIVGNMLEQKQAAQADDPSQRDHQYMNAERKITGEINVSNLNGVAEWQHFNDLGLNQGLPVATSVAEKDIYLNQHQGNTNYIYRNNKVVSHHDAILDMAYVEVNNSMQEQTQMLVTCGRDGLVKLWK